MSDMRVIVRSSTSDGRDLILSCESNWTIADFKKQLERIHPARPAPPNQKIIYAGRLLRDNQSLAQIVSVTGTEGTPVFHLVYQPPSQTAEQLTSTQMSSSVADLRHRPVSTASATGNAQSNQFPSWGSFGQPHFAAQQLMLWQQAYAQYYGHQYAQYLNSLGYSYPQATSTAPAISQSMPAAPAAEVPGAEVGAAEEARPAPVPPAVDPVNQANDEVNAARDWLDWMYLGTRVAVLLTVLFYYSSFSRILMIVLIAIAVYIYQNEYVRPVQREVNNNVNGPNPVDGEEEAADNQGEAAANREPESPSTLSLALSMLTGFFASLIPEIPAPEVL